MGYEDLTTYTEVDSVSNRITVTSAKSAFTAMPQNETCYVYADKGAAHFDGDYEHLFESCITSAAGRAIVWSIANVVDEFYSLVVGGGDLHGVEMIAYAVYLVEYNSGSGYNDSYAGSQGTVYYHKVKRDEAVGTYGTLYDYIYSDASRETLVDTLTLTLHEKQDFRYIYVTQSYDDAGGQASTGYAQNFDLQEGWGNIAKINGVTATDFTKVDGISVDDIAKVNGIAV